MFTPAASASENITASYTILDQNIGVISASLFFFFRNALNTLIARIRARDGHCVLQCTVSISDAIFICGTKVIEQFSE